MAVSSMSLAEIQHQAASLNPEERRQLAAYLTALRTKDTGEWESATATRDQSRDDWVSLEEAKRRLLDEKD